MSDFDPKSIPILDDVIEDAVDVKNASPVLKEATDDFAGDFTDIPDADSEAFESALIDYDTEQTNHAVEVETNYEPFKYQQQTDNNSTINEPYVADPVVEQPAMIPTVEKQAMSAQAAPEHLIPLQINTPSAKAPSLQSITDEIVKKLIPDLEIQLRHLVLQALEDKLPVEIIKAAQTETPADD